MDKCPNTEEKDLGLIPVWVVFLGRIVACFRDNPSAFPFKLQCPIWWVGAGVRRPCLLLLQSQSSAHKCCSGNVTHSFEVRSLGRRASLVAQIVKNLPGVQETHVRSLGREDPLEKGMATHSSNLAWRIPWTEEAGRLQSTRLQRVGHDSD